MRQAPRAGQRVTRAINGAPRAAIHALIVDEPAPAAALRVLVGTTQARVIIDPRHRLSSCYASGVKDARAGGFSHSASNLFQ